MDDFATATNSSTSPSLYRDGSDAEKLAAALDELAVTITTTNRYQNVSITDYLSSDAEWDLTTDANNDGKVDYTCSITHSNGTTETLSDQSVTIEDNHIKWDIVSGDGNELEKDATYSISFRVWPKQNAYDRTASGDLDVYTDADGNAITDASGNQITGIYSNDNDKTVVSWQEVYYQYSSNTGETVKTGTSDQRTSNYERPVMNVPVSTINVEKVWNPSSIAEDTWTATLKLQWKVGSDWKDYEVNGQPLTITLSKDSTTGKWTGSFTNLPAGPDGHEYRVVETATNPSDVIWSTTYTYNVENNGGTGSSYTDAYESAVTSEGVSLKGRANQTASATTTNTKVIYSLQVVKKGRAADADESTATALPGATFQLFEASVDENNVVTTSAQVGSDQVSSDPEGTLTFSKALTPGKTYLLKESVTPAGYVTANPYVLVVGTNGTVTLYKTTVTTNTDGTTITTIDTTSAGTLSTIENDSSTYTMEVTNLKVGDLPSTSGHGVYPLIATGCGLLAVAMLVMKKQFSI